MSSTVGNDPLEGLQVQIIPRRSAHKAPKSVPVIIAAAASDTKVKASSKPMMGKGKVKAPKKGKVAAPKKGNAKVSAPAKAKVQAKQPAKAKAVVGKTSTEKQSVKAPVATAPKADRKSTGKTKSVAVADSTTDKGRRDRPAKVAVSGGTSGAKTKVAP